MIASLNTVHQLSIRSLFVLLVLTFVTSTLVIQEFVLTNDIYYDHFSSQMTFNKVSHAVNILNTWSTFYYFLIPVILFVKLSGIALFLIAGGLFFNVNLSYKKVFQATILGEFVFLIPQAIFIVWFLLIDKSYNMEELRHFEPFSLLSLVGADSVTEWLIYPLKALNLFEIVYVFVVAYVLKFCFNNSFKEALKVVFPSYFFGLFVWLVFVVFMTINFTV